MYHDGCRIADGIKAPDPFEQCILAENDAPVLGQKEKQFEFFICQGNFPFCDEDAMLFRPDLQITAAEGGRLRAAVLPGQALIPCEMCLDAGYELARTERLDNIVIGTEAEAPNFVDVFTPCRYHENGISFSLRTSRTI